ncbi:MAG: response regulator [Acidobacteria bacterium]|nr:response regulator [Acidobacteriota bacterium]MCI0623014.1 response regulator [Acidobacteriota bacterium]MCI0717478.1 response regulator [Acidobacteriota bacterium]
MQKTILIVDFEQESVKELQQVLKSEDFLVLTASDGNQALSVFEAELPDLVLTEALLPNLNGFELCKKIASGELREVRPVIMYSAIYKGEKYQKEAVSGCGALEFLDKPIPKWQLLKAIRTALSAIPLGKTSVDTDLQQNVRVLSLNEPAKNSLAGDAGNVLEVDSLFEEAQSPVREPARAPAAETFILEAPVAESKPSLMPSIDSKEIDAALDAVRIDLHQEVRQRDELLARQFEQELHQGGQSILEFEAASASGAEVTGPPGGQSQSDFELDEVLPQIAASTAATSTERATASTFGSPSFSIKPAASRNWLPILILILLALLAGAFFWFQG